MALKHNQLKPFGIEVDVDLKRELSAADKDELRGLFARDGLIVIHNLKLTLDDQLDLCEIFGPIMRGSRENYLVSNVHKDGLLGDRELQFHNDIPYVPIPFLGASLYAIEVADSVGSTRFANGLRAYDRLPQNLRDRIHGLNALHVRERVPTRRNLISDMEPGDLCTVHPVVGAQKGTERPYLFVNQAMTARITGLPETESEALIEELLSYLYADGEIYEHVWKTGDIVIWDNLALQHARAALSSGARTLQRVSLATIGYWDQCPTEEPVFDMLRTFGKA